MIKNLFLLSCLLAISVAVYCQPATLQIANNKCEYERNPLGIETLQPRFSWELQSKQKNVNQLAYQILVSDDSVKLAQNIAIVWDSKKTTSNQSIQVLYAGKQLQAGKVYFWKVKVWAGKPEMVATSAIFRWQMGLLTSQDWSNAKWITLKELDESKYCGKDSALKQTITRNILPQFRKAFTISKSVKTATAFVSGLGQFDLSLNGRKVSDHFLDPGWTNYDQYSLYVTFDITHQLQKGANALGVMLGNGFYYLPKGRYIKGQIRQHGLPKVIAKILIDYADGTSETIVTDASWKASRSPITYGSIYSGEDYNATLEQAGWNQPNFNDAAWQNSVVVNGPKLIRSQREAPLKVMETFQPISVFQSKKGNWVYDLGQNASGIVRLSVNGTANQLLRVYPAELLDADSAISQAATGKPYCFSYTLNGKSTETWQPQFSYYGFRYVQLEGAVPQGVANPNHLPVVKTLLGLHTRNAAERVGSFSCSDSLLNKINTLIDWAIKSNMASILTDCPHREKLGWLEETHLMMASNQYNYDLALLNNKTVNDMEATQYPNGFCPTTAPEYGMFGGEGKPFSDSPEWGSAYVILPWYMYQWYGDARVLAENYEGMKKYVAYLQSKSHDYIVEYGLGDWFDLGPKKPGPSQLSSLGVTGTATWFYDVTILQKTAALLHKPADEQQFAQLAANIKTAFNQKYFNTTRFQYDRNSQTANAIALYMGLVEPEYQPKVLANIVKDIKGRNNALTAGDIGFRYLMRVLEAGGASDLIYDMNSNSNVPGYGYQLNQGATALTESWQALRNVSNNHLMLGHLMEWFYSGLGGIRQVENSVAFKEIVIHPEIVNNISLAKASYHAPYGLISSEWKKNGTAFELSVQIPVNTTALIEVPGHSAMSVTNQSIQFIKEQNNRTYYKVGSGLYTFKTSLPN